MYYTYHQIAQKGIVNLGRKAEEMFALRFFMSEGRKVSNAKRKSKMV